LSQSFMVSRDAVMARRRRQRREAPGSGGHPVRQLTINGGWSQFVSVIESRGAFKTYGNLQGEQTLYGRLASAGSRDCSALPHSAPITSCTPTQPRVRAMTPSRTDGRIMPDVSYPVTTSKAQGRYPYRARRVNRANRRRARRMIAAIALDVAVYVSLVACCLRFFRNAH